MNSKNTSRRQVPKIFKLIEPKKNEVILDYGGGKFDDGLEFLETKFPGSECVLYDPYNRPDFYNINALEVVKENQGANKGILANVLNVIPHKSLRKKILFELSGLMKPKSEIFISIYKAPRTKKYKETKNIVGQSTIYGWQTCQDAEYFKEEVEEYFEIKEIKNNMIFGIKK